MSGQNKAEENPDEEYLLDALRNLGPTPIEELIDKSNMDDESKKRFHESLRVHDSNIAREQSVKIAVGEALRELDKLSERLDEISALTVWDSSRQMLFLPSRQSASSSSRYADMTMVVWIPVPESVIVWCVMWTVVSCRCSVKCRTGLMGWSI